MDDVISSEIKKDMEVETGGSKIGAMVNRYRSLRSPRSTLLTKSGIGANRSFHLIYSSAFIFYLSTLPFVI
jgi:hypothetical protein